MYFSSAADRNHSYAFLYVYMDSQIKAICFMVSHLWLVFVVIEIYVPFFTDDADLDSDWKASFPGKNCVDWIL